MTKWRLLFGAILALYAAVWLTADPGPPGVPMVEVADSTADWLVTRAAADGFDPYADVNELSDAIGVEYTVYRSSILGDPPYVHPRTPGALLLQLPMLLLDPAALHNVTKILYVLGVAAVILVASRLGGLDGRWLAGAAAAVGMVGPISIGVAFGAQSAYVAVAMALAWLLSRSRDSSWAGLLIGLAATLKLFPLLAVVALVYYRRWKAAAVSVAVVGALNLGGLLLFDLTVEQVVAALAETSRVWLPFGANASFASLFYRLGAPVAVASVASWVLAGCLAVLASMRSRSLDRAFAVTLVLAVLGSPLSWEHYDLVLIPVAGWAWGSTRDWTRYLVGLWAGLFVLGRLARFGDVATRVDLVGAVAMTSRLALLGAIAAPMLGRAPAPIEQVSA